MDSSGCTPLLEPGEVLCDYDYEFWSQTVVQPEVPVLLVWQRAAGLIEEVGPDLFSAPPSGTEVDAARVAELQRRPGSLSALS